LPGRQQNWREADPNIRLTTVFRTADFGLVAIVKSVLENAGIDYFVRGETLRNVLGWGVPGVYGVGPAEFQVREEDAAQAMIILSQLNEDR
jgi:hypothetical protein